MLRLGVTTAFVAAAVCTRPGDLSDRVTMITWVSVYLFDLELFVRMNYRSDLFVQGIALGRCCGSIYFIRLLHRSEGRSDEELRTASIAD